MCYTFSVKFQQNHNAWKQKLVAGGYKAQENQEMQKHYVLFVYFVYILDQTKCFVVNFIFGLFVSGFSQAQRISRVTDGMASMQVSNGSDA